MTEDNIKDRCNRASQAAKVLPYLRMVTFLKANMLRANAKDKVCIHSRTERNTMENGSKTNNMDMVLTGF